MGMFADIVLLSEEGRYVSPYMNYGFTPGAGATWSLADKIGQDLARESLLTAQPYSGRGVIPHIFIDEAMAQSQAKMTGDDAYHERAVQELDRLLGMPR